MKYLIASAALFANLSVAAAAQTMMAPAPAAAAVAAFSIDSPIEQLVANPESETTRISDFLGLGLDPTVLLTSRATAARINTPSYTHANEPAHLRSVGRWRRYGHRLAPVLGTLGITP